MLIFSMGRGEEGAYATVDSVPDLVRGRVKGTIAVVVVSLCNSSKQ